eukprot:scaffold34656_cov178-Amphora_coffeaeformis.AAC.13
MSSEGPPPAAAAASSPSDGKVHGSDIAEVLTSSGPVVNCVLLRHMRNDAKDVKPHPVSTKVDQTHKREVLTELIEDIQVDTTPSKSAIKGILGPFTFIGQFPTEGIVAMARKELPEDLKSLSIGKLRALCEEADIDTQGMLEKNEMVQALENSLLPVNPHKLQPPLDGIVVRGDILLLKVAETEETLDEPNGEEKDMHVLSNEEFFLNYTKEEYVAFASRTDVEEEEEEDEDFNPSADGDPDEEEKCAMLNLIMAEVLRKFREEKGRGPSSEELLELRRQVAVPLGVEVTTAEDISSKRAAEDGDGEEERSTKRVKFGQKNDRGEEDEEVGKKPAATPASGDQDEGEKKGDDEPES